MRHYLGHLASGDPLYSYLGRAILPLVAEAAREPRWRVYRVSAVSDVYLYEDKWSGARVVGKFYARARGLNGSGAPQSAVHEYRALEYLRHLGFNVLPDYVVRPLGHNMDLGDLLVVEHVAGEQLDGVIEAAAREGRAGRLYRKLTDLARFFARLHNRTAGGPGVDFARTLSYFERVVEHLTVSGLISGRRIERLRGLAQRHAARPTLWQDWQVMVHGDATPSNFLFGQGREVLAIDLERMHRDDRAYDVGRLCGELKHCFLRATGEAGASEPFIGHFLWEYAGHFPDQERAFAAITGRLPFHLGLTLLRIARNSWLDAGYRSRLVREATTILEGGLP
jgi:aminoglycoside phosphotransferase (APT) family kinase protein